MLSGAKNLLVRREILRSTQHDSQQGAMELDKVVGAQFIAPWHEPQQCASPVGARFIAPPVLETHENEFFRNEC